MSSLPHSCDDPPAALVLAWYEEEAENQRLAAEAEYERTRVPAPIIESGFLTRLQMAEALHVSARTLDTHLKDETFLQATGAWKTSGGRMSHWRFPPSAPERAKEFLTGRRR